MQLHVTHTNTIYLFQWPLTSSITAMFIPIICWRWRLDQARLPPLAFPTCGLGPLPSGPPRPAPSSLPQTRDPIRLSPWLQQVQYSAICSSQPRLSCCQVDSYIAEELASGKLQRMSSCTGIHVSPIGLIPKKGRPGKFRLMSDPQGWSVNDGIDPRLCTFKYASIRDAASRVRNGAYMAKLDLKCAYRMVPVHPADQWLLGIQWRDAIYCDSALPFGLRFAPIIFNSIADALTWAGAS